MRIFLLNKWELSLRLSPSTCASMWVVYIKCFTDLIGRYWMILFEDDQIRPWCHSHESRITSGYFEFSLENQIKLYNGTIYVDKILYRTCKPRKLRIDSEPNKNEEETFNWQKQICEIHMSPLCIQNIPQCWHVLNNGRSRCSELVIAFLDTFIRNIDCANHTHISIIYVYIFVYN